MNYTDFSNNIILFANSMSVIYETHQKNIINDLTLNSISVSLSDDFYTNVFLSFENYINNFINQEKISLETKINDVENYIDDLLNFGITSNITNDLDSIRYVNFQQNIEQIYRLKYILDYYEKMVNSNDANSWVFNLSEFDKINSTEYYRFKIQTEHIISSYT